MNARRLLLVWLALLALLGMSAASAFAPLGVWNGVLNLVIALAKSVLVALFFMHLARSGALPRIVALTALFTLALLLGLSSADYASRSMYRAPWTAPPASQTEAARAADLAPLVSLLR
jgi:cytochrome c oxidase subunit 4